ASRRKEFGMRFALGATRGRIISQLLTESLLLSVIAGAMGLALGDFGSRILVSFFSRNWSMPLQLDVHPDARVFASAVLVAVAVGVVVGLSPALGRARQHLPVLGTESESVTIGTRRRLARGSLIVMLQIPLAVPLLGGAAHDAHPMRSLKAQEVEFN